MHMSDELIGAFYPKACRQNTCCGRIRNKALLLLACVAFDWEEGPRCKNKIAFRPDMPLIRFLYHQVKIKRLFSLLSTAKLLIYFQIIIMLRPLNLYSTSYWIYAKKYDQFSFTNPIFQFKIKWHSDQTWTTTSLLLRVYADWPFEIPSFPTSFQPQRTTSPQPCRVTHLPHWATSLQPRRGVPTKSS